VNKAHRWFVLSIFVLSSTINYLDRQTLATLAPVIRGELGLSNAEYGWVVSAFSITYAACAPFAGLLIDRIGLDRGITLAIGLWSLAALATGWVRGFAGLLVCRAALGIAEAGGIPAAGKAIQRYLLPPERALGNSLNQVGVSLGLILAPPVATWLAVEYNWRTAFMATAGLGILWIPLWRAVRIPSALPDKSPPRALGMLGDRRLWGFALANALSMIPYSLWTNWTTLHLVDVNHLSFVRAAWFAWWPPLFGALGGLAGGALSFRWMNAGLDAVAARTRVCRLAALGCLVTAAIPWAPDAVFAAAGISLSFFSVAAFSVNMYSLPLDVFPAARAAFAVSLLVSAYGAMQAFASPAVGAVVDRWGYGPVCLGSSVMPLAAAGILKWTEARR
ncbi:MAG TPA: MFS transporter, partial [Bryobacteraceae bacterium]|jgi:MFS transporter, ACS family, aldohexuronate transporter|nr:MFS transporter [Bryobacteraceae bacterium]